MSNFVYFLITYAAGVCLAVMTARVPGRDKWKRSVWTLMLLAASVAIASVAMPGQNIIVQFFVSMKALDRTVICLSTAGALSGILTGRSVSPAFGGTGNNIVLPILLYTGVIGSISLLVAKDLISPWIANSSATGMTGVVLQQNVVDGFEIAEFAQLSISPTCLAIGPDGAVYVAGLGGLAFQNGTIVRLGSSESGSVSVQTVADYLNRPHGIAFHEGDMFISRAGQFSHAVEGRIVQADTGVITRARDLDGDGLYDHYTDIIKDLPGAQQPDGLHQNNGIVFNDGFLFVTVGIPSDHGPALHRYAGTILRARPDGSEVTVFAEGFRNPFGITVGPNGDLFCTDNDASVETGDEINLVLQGKHYGHPYTSIDRQTQVSGVIQPLLNCSSAQGIGFAPPNSLPAGYDNCLYLAAFADDMINRVQLTPKENGLVAKVDFFAQVPGVIDVAVSNDGVIYACSHTERKVYRIRVK